jgi:hypothetical protein
VVALGVLASSPTPTVTGTNRVGNSLAASVGAWDSGVSLAFQWFRDGVAIPGAVGSTYSLIAEDVGASVSLTVTGTKAGYQSVTRSRTVSGVVALGVLASSPTPTVTGPMDLSVWPPLEVSTGTWDSGVSLSYQWFRGGVVVPGAVGAKYPLAPEDVGSVISVSVTGSKPGYQTVTRNRAIPNAVGVAVWVTGTNQNGSSSTSQSNIGAFHREDSGLSYEYQWYVCTQAVTVAAATLPSHCTEHQRSLSNQKAARIWQSDGGLRFLVGLKTMNGTKSVWRYSTTTQPIITPPQMNSFAKVATALPLAANLDLGWRGFESSWGTAEQDQLNYGHWRKEGETYFSVNRGGASSYPSSSAVAHTWYTCTELLNPGSSMAIRFGNQFPYAIPSDCASRGNDNFFYPNASEDAGKYVAVLVTYQNSTFQSTYFFRTGNQISLAPQIASALASGKPEIVGEADQGATLHYQAEYRGYPAPQNEIEWYRCKQPINEIWVHDLPISGVSPENLVSSRKNQRIPADYFMNNGCVQIPDVSGNYYTLSELDRGLWIAVFDSATNSAGSSSVFTASTSRVDFPPYLIEKTRTDGSAIVPQLRCYTNAITNTHCRQDSGYVQGSNNIIKTIMPATTDQFADSWRFRGSPGAELTQTWFLCPNRVDVYAHAVPDDCREIPGESTNSLPDLSTVYRVQPEDWGSWVVTMYTATNRLGTLSLVAGARYLSGNAYSLSD